MDKLLKVKHSYNLGDLITILPGFKAIYDKTGIKTTIYQELDRPAYYFDDSEHPIKDANGRQVCMNSDAFDMMWYLLREQEYIQEFLVWYGERVDWDMGKTRETRLVDARCGSIFHTPFMIFPDLTCDLSKPWLTVGESMNAGYLANKILVGRTERYTNLYINYYFLKEYESRVLFIGTMKEYDIFRKKYDLNIGKLNYDNFLQYAQAIKACKLFIGNQSLFFHLSNALSTFNLLEICSGFPNTWPTNGNGHGFLTQEGLEHLFKKLIN